MPCILSARAAGRAGAWQRSDDPLKPRGPRSSGGEPHSDETRRWPEPRAKTRGVRVPACTGLSPHGRPARSARDQPVARSRGVHPVGEADELDPSTAGQPAIPSTPSSRLTSAAAPKAPNVFSRLFRIFGGSAEGARTQAQEERLPWPLAARARPPVPAPGAQRLDVLPRRRREIQRGPGAPRRRPRSRERSARPGHRYRRADSASAPGIAEDAASGAEIKSGSRTRSCRHLHVAVVLFRRRGPVYDVAEPQGIPEDRWRSASPRPTSG